MRENNAWSRLDGVILNFGRLSGFINKSEKPFRKCGRAQGASTVAATCKNQRVHAASLNLFFWAAVEQMELDATSGLLDCIWHIFDLRPDSLQRRGFKGLQGGLKGGFKESKGVSNES